MEKQFARDKLEELEQKRRFMSWLRLEIRKMCVMKDYANMESLLNVALEVEQILVELSEIIFELLKEKHEENLNVGETTMEK